MDGWLALTPRTSKQVAMLTPPANQDGCKTKLEGIGAALMKADGQEVVIKMKVNTPAPLDILIRFCKVSSISLSQYSWVGSKAAVGA